MTRRKPVQEPSDQERLRAVRDRLETVLADDSTSPRDLAVVAREYRILLDRLAAEKPATTSSALDDLRARRQARGAS